MSDNKTEVRMTILKDGKRVDIHIFDADAIVTGSLLDLFERAKDASKIECNIVNGKVEPITGK